MNTKWAYKETREKRKRPDRSFRPPARHTCFLPFLRGTKENPKIYKTKRILICENDFFNEINDLQGKSTGAEVNSNISSGETTTTTTRSGSKIPKPRPVPVLKFKSPFAVAATSLTSTPGSTSEANKTYTKASSTSSSASTSRSSTPESEMDQEEAMLRQLYLQCDELRTGGVLASTLVKTIQDLLDPQHHVSKWSLQDLSRMLDPRLDDQKVDEDEFVAVGLKWVAKVKLAEQREQERIRQVSGGSSQEEEEDGLVPKRWAKMNRRHVRSNSLGGFGGGGEDDMTSTSSLGLLDTRVVLDATFGSLEGLGVGDNWRSEAKDETELTSELEHLRRAVKRLSQEKSTLKNQFSSADDLVGQLQKENDDLKDRLKSTQNSLQFHVKMREKEEDGDDSGDKGESRMQMVLKENARLQEELDIARCSLKVAKEDQKAANDEAEAATKQLQVLKKDDADKKNTCEELKGQVERLRKDLEETREVNVSLKSEIERMNGDLSMKEEELRNALMVGGGSAEPEVSHDLLDLSGCGDQVWNNLNSSYFKKEGGPKAMSTPFIKNVK